MQDTKAMHNAAQATVQPYIKLMQANMDLLNRFTGSLDLSTPAGSHVANPIRATQDMLSKMMQSTAMTTLMQGLAKNYGDFLTDFGQQSMQLMSQTQETMQQQTREAADHVMDATQSRVRHVRSATA
jgi:gas vesicle protein